MKKSPDKLRRTIDMQITGVKNLVYDAVEAEDEQERYLAVTKVMHELDNISDIIYVVSKNCMVLKVKRLRSNRLIHKD